MDHGWPWMSVVVLRRRGPMETCSLGWVGRMETLRFGCKVERRKRTDEKREGRAEERREEMREDEKRESVLMCVSPRRDDALVRSAAVSLSVSNRVSGG